MRTGFVLEIGVGSGQNLPLYGSAVDHVCAIDPSAELLRLAGNRTADVSVPVSLVRG
jgi:protein-L-isoaspartate O-methyltransferase